MHWTVQIKYKTIRTQIWITKDQKIEKKKPYIRNVLIP